jgi:hypothetical protein
LCDASWLYPIGHWIFCNNKQFFLFLNTITTPFLLLVTVGREELVAAKRAGSVGDWDDDDDDGIGEFWTRGGLEGCDMDGTRGLGGRGRRHRLDKVWEADLDYKDILDVNENLE